jgi:hypothetical protein
MALLHLSGNACRFKRTILVRHPVAAMLKPAQSSGKIPMSDVKVGQQEGYFQLSSYCHLPRGGKFFGGSSREGSEVG